MRDDKGQNWDSSSGEGVSALRTEVLRREKFTTVINGPRFLS